MYLDEAFDRGSDAAHRAERPIPQGEVSARLVFQAGFGMMAAALVILAVATDAATFVAGLVLAGLVLVYDVSHKGNRFAPAISIASMGLARVAVYGVAAEARPGETFAPPVVVGAAFLFLYLVMLSMIARQETTDPKRPRLVGRLIAGISLVDGVQLLAVGQPWVALGGMGAFFLTLSLQKARRRNVRPLREEVKEHGLLHVDGVDSRRAGASNSLVMKSRPSSGASVRRPCEALSRATRRAARRRAARGSRACGPPSSVAPIFSLGNAGPDRGRARRGRSQLDGACRRCARSPARGRRRASRGTRTSGHAWSRRRAHPSAGDRGRARAFRPRPRHSRRPPARAPAARTPRRRARDVLT